MTLEDNLYPAQSEQIPVGDEVIPEDPDAEWVDERFRALVAELEGAGVDPVREDIEHLRWIQRQEAALYADRACTLMRIVSTELAQPGASSSGGPTGSDLDLALRSVAAEVAIALRVSDRTIQARLSDAQTLVEDFPLTCDALLVGTIGIGHARVIIEAGAVITDAARRADYETAVLERAARVTPGRLRPVARIAAERLTDTDFETRHDQAKTTRSVTCVETGDGMSEILAIVPTVLAVGIRDRLTQMGNAVKTENPEDLRTLDQLRADVFCELLLVGQPDEGVGSPHGAAAGIRAEVAVQIPVLTLLGEGDTPATLLGGGPIGMDDALRLAAGVPALVRVITDPVTDEVLATDNYRPGKRLRRYLQWRDGHCRCPSCGRTAMRSDIDHTVPYSEGGLTEAGNLECLCPGHHTIKHLSGWGLRQIRPGVLEWTTPHGFVAVDRPDTPIRFRAE